MLIGAFRSGRPTREEGYTKHRPSSGISIKNSVAPIECIYDEAHMKKWQEVQSSTYHA